MLSALLSPRLKVLSSMKESVDQATPPAESQQPSDKAATAGSICLAGVTILFGLAGAVAIGWTRKGFLRMAEEFEVELPLLTRFVLSPLMVGLLLTLALIAIGKELPVGLTRRGRNQANWFLLLLIAAALTAFAFGVMGPVMQTLDGLSAK